MGMETIKNLNCKTRKSNFISVVTLLAIAVIYHPVEAISQSMEPRAYSNAPTGLNFLIARYVYRQGEVLLDPSLPVTDLNVRIHTAVLAYARSLDVFGKSGKLNVVVPYAWLSGTGKLNEVAKRRTIDGLADPAVRFSVNIILDYTNAPR
jgi:hypothetical protein